MRREKLNIGQAHINDLYVGLLNGKLGTQARLSSMLSRYTLEEFETNPVCAKTLGGACAGVQGEVDVMSLEENIFEYCILGVGQTILAPSLVAGGLNVSLDQIEDEGVEVSQGITARSRAAFVVGTDAFFLKVKFSIANVSGTDDCAIGFRKAEAYKAAIDDYDEMAALNVISGAIYTETILNGDPTVPTDTTDAWEDGEEHTLEVYVDLAGNVTYKIDGIAPTASVAFAFDATEVVVPFMYFLHAGAPVAGEVNLISWECGLTM